jgi:hypothetical protein
MWASDATLEEVSQQIERILRVGVELPPELSTDSLLTTNHSPLTTNHQISIS